jgi:hydrogenase maturation protein HypF
MIAPGNPMLGIMLPYTPLHHLLMDAMRRPLVMTSGNRSDEPIATGEPEVFERLRGIADVFLTHNRPIHVRCDDSVARVVCERESMVRRSRGYAPQPIRLPSPCDVPILAVGGQLKNTFALGHRGKAILSHHLGDLDHAAAYRAFERDIALYEQLFAIRPRAIAHDLHPDYGSTRYALRRAAAGSIPTIAVQHHHAHMASCMAEHGLDEPVIGVSFDGAGYGADGAVWGGEFLIGDNRSFQRAAHLRYVRMPGGEQAIREPWRMAIAHLADAGASCPDDLHQRIGHQPVRVVEQMLERQVNAPLTSSAGRLFDAVAAILGVRDRVNFEGQAAMELEWLATPAESDERYPFDPPAAPGTLNAALQLDTRPMLRALLRDRTCGTAPGVIARKFHATLAEMILNTCSLLREMTQINVVVLSGGVFLNSLLLSDANTRLHHNGFRIYSHQRVPTNDGGISLGQLAVAARQIGESPCA